MQEWSMLNICSMFSLKLAPISGKGPRAKYVTKLLFVMFHQRCLKFVFRLHYFAQ